MSWLFASGGQSIGASAPILPVNIQYWFPLGFTSLILLSKRLSRVFSSTTVQKCRFFGARWGYKNFCISRVTETLLYLVTAAQVLNWTTSALLASAVWAVRTTPGRESDLQKCLKWDQITEKAMAPNSSTLAWKIPRTEEPAGLQSMGSLRVGHDRATSLSLFTFTFHFHLLSLFTCMPRRRKWQPTPVFLPGESQGRGSLVGCHLWGRTESDTTEAT